MTTHHLPTPARLDIDALDIDALAHAVASDGIDAHDHAVQRVVAAAGMVAGATALAVIADRTAPAVARERALGRVLERLAHAAPRSVGHHLPPRSLAA